MTFWSILRQRCWGLVLVVAGVCVITFIISHLIPGDPARLLAGDRASDAIVENIRQQLGLDQPLYVQFYRYVSDLFHGDLGTSIRTGRPVLEELRIFFPATLELAFCALLLALLIGIPLGILSAVWRNRWLDHLVRIMAITGISTPAFWLCCFMVICKFFPAAEGLMTGWIHQRTLPAFICSMRCLKATVKSSSMRCNISSYRH